MFDLPGRNEVEGKRPRVGLGAGHGGAVDPDVVVSLGESPGDHELVVDERNAGDAADDLPRVAVLRAGDGLARNAAYNHHRMAHVEIDRRLAVPPPHGGHHHLVDLLALLFQRGIRAGRLPAPHLDVRNQTGCIGKHRHLEIVRSGVETGDAVTAHRVAGGAPQRTLHNHRRTGHGVSRRPVGNRALDRSLRRSLGQPDPQCRTHGGPT